MNFRMLKKKYRKMYGQNPRYWMTERLIKTRVSPSEYREIKAIGIKTNFMKVIFTVADELRKEMRQYERNTANLVNATRILSERRKM